MDKILEEKILDESRWEDGKECLNLDNIHIAPYYFTGNREEWISELATFIFLYPREWDCIQKEYVQYLKEIGKSSSVFKYERTDEGELRRIGENDILLCISTSDIHIHLNEVAEWFLESDIMDFDSYERYCNSSDIVRREILQHITEKVTEHVCSERKTNEDIIRVTFAADYAESCFEGKELFIDILNRTYLIL